MKIRTKIGHLFDFVSSYQKDLLVKNHFYPVPFGLKIRDECNRWVPISSLIIKNDQIRRIQFDTGEILRVSNHHLLCIDKVNCRRASELSPGDTLIKADGSIATVVFSELEMVKEDVYDFTVNSSTHLYQSANGFIHHNTASSIITLSHWYHKGMVDGIVILTRSIMLYHWLIEFLEFSTIFQESDIQIITNKNKKRPFEQYRDKKVLIIPNHLWADICISYRVANGKKPRSLKKIQWKPYVDILEKWGKKTLALLSDEHHDFKNLKAVKTKALQAFIDQFDFRIWASATPAINSFEDWYGQMKLLDPGAIPMNQGAFHALVAQEIGDDYNPQAIQKYDPEKVKEIEAMIRPYLLKRMKSEIPEMQARQVLDVVYLEPSMVQNGLYKVFRAKETTRSFASPTEIMKRYKWTILGLDNPDLLRQHDDIPPRAQTLLDRWEISQDPRYKYLEELARDWILEQGEKLIVFDVHPLTLDQLYEKFNTPDFRPAIIHGQVDTKDTAKHRQEAQDRFNNDPKCKMIFLSFATSSAGINLYKGGNRIIFYTQPSDATLFRQAMDRTHRIVSTRDTQVTSLVFPRTLDVIRYRRNYHRVRFNDEFLHKDLTPEEIENLLNGEWTPE
jgi:hypothetical protein